MNGYIGVASPCRVPAGSVFAYPSLASDMEVEISTELKDPYS